MAPIPITIITGFLGSGKTTLLLNLLPQLRAQNPAYKLALLKNEFGDVAIDSQLASSSSISGVRELLNGCICCNLVGQLDTALEELRSTITPDRIVVETSGSAFPATLAMEVNRLARETNGGYVLDGVVTVIDVENWKGYEDTSYTAKIQARYTDLIVLNKWEGVDERRLDECLDRVGDLEVQVATVKSDKGKVPVGLVFGVDGALARSLGDDAKEDSHDHNHDHTHEHAKTHQSEVEVLSVTFEADIGAKVDTSKLAKLLKSAPKDEVYRIKAVLTASSPVPSPDENTGESDPKPVEGGRYILNWAFGRWTCTPMNSTADEHQSSSGVVLRMTMILARYESTKWKKRLETADFFALDGDQKGRLVVEKII
ncbi:putative GTP-binding protein [Lachnellula occidentalis]|uniref:Putative GTP-binding protein n=1 Tax=Lachnellula occidentalis TaxID=215460 RepID=A0A8H8UD44_9HELO|nr:putative GTP-binding protein [Lachnellula occidentalis]